MTLADIADLARRAADPAATFTAAEVRDLCEVARSVLAMKKRLDGHIAALVARFDQECAGWRGTCTKLQRTLADTNKTLEDSVRLNARQARVIRRLRGRIGRMQERREGQERQERHDGQEEQEP